MKKPRPTPKTSVGTHATTANPDGDQRKPPSFQRFEPRPPASLGPGIETRHPYRSQSRRHDALLARQKRGVAAAQPRNHHRSRDRHPLTEENHPSLLAGRVRKGNRAEFSKKETQSVFTPQVRISRKRIFCFRSTDAQNPKIDGKAIATNR